MENAGEFLIPLIWFGVVIFAIAGLWKTFSKAGHPGWACLVPIYNMVVMLQIAGRPVWWMILMFVPILNIVFAIIVAMDIAKRFGKGAGFGLGLAFLGFIFYPILGFGEAEYDMVPAR